MVWYGSVLRIWGKPCLGAHIEMQISLHQLSSLTVFCDRLWETEFTCWMLLVI